MMDIECRITLVLEGRVHPGGHDALEAFLAEARAYYERPGGIRVRLQRDANDPERFRETIEYATREAYELDDERTRSDPVMQRYLSRWRDLLAGPPTVSVWEERSI